MRKNWGLLAFGLAWLAIWTGGGATALVQLLLGNRADRSFLIGWLMVWLPAELAVAYACLWGMFGKEFVGFTEEAMTIQSSLFGLGRDRRFNRAEIHNVRASPGPGSIFSLTASLAFWGLWGGSVAFDYRGRTHRFALQLEDAEARKLSDWVSSLLN